MAQLGRSEVVSAPNLTAGYFSMSLRSSFSLVAASARQAGDVHSAPSGGRHMRSPDVSVPERRRARKIAGAEIVSEFG